MNHCNDFPPEAIEVLDHLRPAIRISPFSGLSMMHSLTPVSHPVASKGDSLDPALWQDGGTQLTFYRSGRDAITASLRALGLSTSDVVSIITTSGGPYVSSCVTRAIEAICKTSRELEPNTAAILLIHEFGFPAELPERARKLGVPIIEDCAYAFGTRLRSKRVGSIGDFVIYSLPKSLPIPFGGMLVSRGPVHRKLPSNPLSKAAHDFLSTYMRQTYPHWEGWNELRRENWWHFAKTCSAFGLTPYFDMTNDVIPGVCLLRLPASSNGPAMKARCQNAGIECTEYYGQNGFYFPVHQCLTAYDKAYILNNLLHSEDTEPL